MVQLGPAHSGTAAGGGRRALADVDRVLHADRASPRRPPVARDARLARGGAPAVTGRARASVPPGGREPAAGATHPARAAGELARAARPDARHGGDHPRREAGGHRLERAGGAPLRGLRGEDAGGAEPGAPLLPPSRPAGASLRDVALEGLRGVPDDRAANRGGALSPGRRARGAGHRAAEPEPSFRASVAVRRDLRAAARAEEDGAPGGRPAAPVVRSPGRAGARSAGGALHGDAADAVGPRAPGAGQARACGTARNGRRRKFL